MRIDTSSPHIFMKNNLLITDITNEENSSLRNSASVNTDKLVIEYLYGGDKEITKDDALLYKYLRENPISLYDQSQNKVTKDVNSVADIPKDYIDGLNGGKITFWDSYRLNYALDYTQSYDNIESSVERFAATYVTTLNHLNANFSGAQLEGYVKELEATISELVHKRANTFADGVGAFLEKNGFDNESEKIYNSILNEYNNKVAQYSDFIKNNSDYANLKNSPDEWLSNDVAYMAQELRKSCPVQALDETDSDSNYSLKELSLAICFVREVNSTGLFQSLGNEESFGMAAGMLLLKTNLFAENCGASSKLADMMTDAVKTHIDKEIDSENERIRKLYNDPLYDKVKSPVYDKSAIYRVANKMMSIYRIKGDYTAAILDGIAYAQNTSKNKEKEYEIMERYNNNTYWEQFYDNSRAFSSKKFVYVKGEDRRTSFEELVESWNDFTYDLSKSNAYQLKLNGK